MGAGGWRDCREPMFGGWGRSWCSVPHLLSGLRQVVSPPNLSSLLPGTVTLGTGQDVARKEHGLR